MPIKFAKFSICFSAVLLLVGVFAMPSAAQAGQGWQDAPWRFSAKGYGWMPSAPVSIKIDQDEVANMPESFDNIFDALEFAAMFELEAHKGPLGFSISPIYYDGKATPSQVYVGYRYLHLDYEDDPLEIEVDVKGPLVGFGVDF